MVPDAKRTILIDLTASSDQIRDRMNQSVDSAQLIQTSMVGSRLLTGASFGVRAA